MCAYKCYCDFVVVGWKCVYLAGNKDAASCGTPSIFPSPQSKLVRVCCFIYGVAIILVLLVGENILLDSNFSAKIGDFAVAQLTTPKQVGSPLPNLYRAGDTYHQNTQKAIKAHGQMCSVMEYYV